MASERLVYRRLSPDDFPFYFRLVGDARVMAKVTGQALDPVQARERLARATAQPPLHPFLGFFLAFERLSGQFAGQFKLESHGPDEAELGYLLLPELWGRGLASEMGRHACQLAARVPGLKRLRALIDPSNAPSRRVLLGLGFRPEGPSTWESLPAESFWRSPVSLD